MNGNILQMQRIVYFALILIFPFSFLSCQKEKTDEELPKNGKVTLNFEMEIDGRSLITNEMQYQNASGNVYEVNEVKFFISDIKFHKADGAVVTVQDGRSVHYYDWDIPTTHNWDIADNFPVGEYDSISFTFGLSPEKNVSGYFVNPPENNMSWPAVLGGGYHYMQINGKWKNLQDSVRVLNFHTGIGQLYENNQVTEFVPNHFTVVLSHPFQISADATTHLNLLMNINKWFTSPHDYDFNVWGGSIMQNQAAQQVIKENGRDVFSITSSF